ncbi:MAG: c-type cytochrome [Acidimicrobiia bacterium]
MSSSLVITIAVTIAIVWLAFLGVSALRSRSREEVPANLAPGATDDTLETRRLERIQQAAVLLSAFLAVSLPLYFLGEPNRQEGFQEQFDEESLHRGEELVAEFQCWNCHGPDGVGGAASYVEKRTGVQVTWAAPPLNDIFYRYGRDEVVYWTTFGRGNSPMPAWGVPGGGPMNEAQVEDVVNYLQSIQLPQSEVVADTEAVVAGARQALANADDVLAGFIVTQSQIVEDLQRSPELAGPAREIAESARAALDAAGEGIDTDGDGISDVSEVGISQASIDAVELLTPPGLEAIVFDPNDPESTGRPDADTAAEVAALLRELAGSGYPALGPFADAVEAALEETGEDTDGDGLPDTAETAITTQLALAVVETLPPGLGVVELDPSNPATSGEPDAVVARRVVAELESVALGLRIQADNLESLLPPAEEGLANLRAAQRERRWEIDVEGVAASAFGGDLERAERAVALFNGYCARCHTSGWSAGVPFAQEPGSGGFGPALWDGRPQVQFLQKGDLQEFLLVGALINRPYGVNGFGNGQMPGFGQQLSSDDLGLIVDYLWAGDLNGKGGG